MPITLAKNEKILLLLRRHKFVYYKNLSTILFAVALPLIAYGISRSATPQLFEYPFTHLIWVAAIFYTLFLLDYICIIWLDYYLDVWIVTDERIVDIEMKGLFSREFSEFKLSRVQDVTIQVHGFLPTLLNFGDVHVRTAGESRSFVFYQVKDPYKAKEVILKAHDDYMEKKLRFRHDIAEGA